MDGTLMQVNLCPSSNNGKASCSVLTKTDRPSEIVAVVRLDQTITSICPLDGQIALITNPSTLKHAAEYDGATCPPLKRKCLELKNHNFEFENNNYRKNKLWLQENMKKAINAVRNGMFIRTASKQFSVPRTTLKYKLSSNGYIIDNTEDIETPPSYNKLDGNGYRIDNIEVIETPPSYNTQDVDATNINKKDNINDSGNVVQSVKHDIPSTSVQYKNVMLDSDQTITVNTTHNKDSLTSYSGQGITKEKKKIKLWSEESMCRAIEAVNNGSKIGETALLYGIPLSTLHSRLLASRERASNTITTTETNIYPKAYTRILPAPPKHQPNSTAISTMQYIATNTLQNKDNLNPSEGKEKKKCKLWSEETMSEAVEAVNKGSKIKDAATLYGIPLSTLGNRLLASKRKANPDIGNNETSSSAFTAAQVELFAKAYPRILPAPPKHQPMRTTTTAAQCTSQVPDSQAAPPTRSIPSEVFTVKRSVPVLLKTNNTTKQIPASKRPKGPFKQWSEESMQKALKAIIEEGLSIYAAARKYNVPKSTLDARKKRVDYNNNYSSITDIIIDPEDEYPLVCYVNVCARFGITKIKNVVLLLAAERAEHRGRWNIKQQGLVPDAWWESFCDRRARLIKNVDITHHPPGLTKARISLFFDKLLAVINSSQYHKLPLTCLDKRIFTVQEFRFKVDAVRGWVFDNSNNTDSSNDNSKDSDNSNDTHDNDNDNSDSNNNTNSDKVSTMCCVNASGASLSPMFVYHTSDSECTINQTGPHQAIVHDINDKSRNSDYYYKWFTEVFIKHALQIRPLILLLDPETSFITPDLIALANKHKIILLCLPPLSAHLTQPLNTAVRPALQQGLNEGSSKIKDFPCCFKEAWVSTVTVATIKSGFFMSGIYPPNRNKFDQHDIPAM